MQRRLCTHLLPAEDLFTVREEIVKSKRVDLKGAYANFVKRRSEHVKKRVDELLSRGV